MLKSGFRVLLFTKIYFLSKKKMNFFSNFYLRYNFNTEKKYIHRIYANTCERSI